VLGMHGDLVPRSGVFRSLRSLCNSDDCALRYSQVALIFLVHWQRGLITPISLKKRVVEAICHSSLTLDTSRNGSRVWYSLDTCICRNGGWTASGIRRPSQLYSTEKRFDGVLTRCVLHPVRPPRYIFCLDTDAPYTSLIANITRLFFWLGVRFETPLLVQSILMILAQVRLVMS
jgi:hypothetical protein